MVRSLHVEHRNVDADSGAELAGLQLSNSSVYLGLDAFFGQIPIFLFSLFGGVFADRKNRRNILLASQFVQLICAFLLAALCARTWSRFGISGASPSR